MRPRPADCALYPHSLRLSPNTPFLFPRPPVVAIARRLSCPASLPAPIGRAPTAHPRLLYLVAGRFRSNNRKAKSAWRRHSDRSPALSAPYPAFLERPALADKQLQFVRAP